MSIQIEELRKHPWPKPNFPIGQEVLDRAAPDDPRGIPDDNGTPLIPRPGYSYSGRKWPLDYTSSCFIPQERVLCIPLDGIPNGSSAVRALLADGDTLYGVTGGENTYAFTRKGDAFSAWRIAAGVSGIAMLTTASGPVILLADGRIVTHRGAEYAKLPSSVANAGAGDGHFGGLLADGTLFCFDVQEKRLRTCDVSGNAFSPAFALAGNVLYGAFADGVFFRWDGGDVRRLNCRMPAFAGRHVYNRVSVLCHAGDGRTFWGGTSEDGLLFEFLPGEEVVRCYGKALGGRGISALTISNGILYGIGCAGCSHLFRRNPATGELTDEGLVQVSAPRSWCLYEGGVIHPDGQGGVWVGEADRISHLFHIRF